MSAGKYDAISSTIRYLLPIHFSNDPLGRVYTGRLNRSFKAVSGGSHYILLWDIGARGRNISVEIVDKSIYSRRQEYLQQVLRDIRIEAGMRQVDLARKLCLPQSFVSKYESGERRLDLLELEQVCIYCGITLVDFVTRLTTPPDNEA